MSTSMKCLTLVAAMALLTGDVSGGFAAPSAAAAALGLPALELSFEISNYNYDDLNQDCPEPIYVGRHKHSSKRHAVEKVLSLSAKKSASGSRSWPQYREERAIENCVGEVVRDTIRSSILQVVEEGLANATFASAPAAAKVSILAKKSIGTSAAVAAAPPAAAAADSNSSSAPVDVHVKLFPGHTMKIKSSLTSDGKTIRANVTIVGKAGTGADELPSVEVAIKAAQLDRKLMLVVADHLYQNGGMHPTIVNVNIQHIQVQQWSDGICQAHISTVVKRFTMAYTRRLVPAALFNECTNFMPMVSFSDDGMVNKVDKQKCQAATAKFAKNWNYGKAKKAGVSGPASAAAAPAAALAPGPAAAGMDYAEFCTDICEMKFGQGAAQCHVSLGEGRLAKGP